MSQSHVNATIACLASQPEMPPPIFLALKTQIFVKQTKEEWEDTNGELYQVDTTTQPTRYGDVVLAKDNTGAYYSSGYVITAPLDLGNDIYRIDRIRYSATTGEKVRITVQIKVGNTIDELNADTWSSEYSALTDDDGEKKGIEFSLFNKPTKKYIKVKLNLYTDDTETPNNDGTVFGFTPILHSCEVIARYTTELDISLIPASLGITLEKEEFSYQNHLEIFNSICQKGEITGYVNTNKQIIVKKETDLDYLGSDLTNKVILRHGKEINISQLSDETTELVNCLICLGAGEGGKQLRTILKDTDSINTYGEHWGIYENSQITTMTDLITKGTEYLNKQKNPQQRFEIQILRYKNEWGEFSLGDKVRVISQILNIDTTGRILEEKRDYTSGREIITVGINSVLGTLIDSITGVSEIKTKKIATPPPLDLKLIPGHGFIELRWTGNADYFIILHSTDGTNYSVLENHFIGSTYRHLNLELGSHHWYKVYAVKNNIISSPAGPIDGYAKDLQAPATPTGLTVNCVVRELIVTLNANSEPDWDGFEIHVSTTNNFTPDATTLKAKGKSTRFNILGMAPNTTYYIKAIAYDLSGNKSNPTPQVSITTSALTKRFVAYASEFSTTSTDYVPIPESRFIYESNSMGAYTVWQVLFRCSSYETNIYAQLWNETDGTEVAVLEYPALQPGPNPTPWLQRETSVTLTNNKQYITRLRTSTTSATAYLAKSIIKYD